MDEAIMNGDLSLMVTSLDEVRWVRDKAGLLVIHSGTGEVLLLKDIEACLWDWLQMAGWEEAIEFSAAYLHTSKERAVEVAAEILKKWHRFGFIELSGVHCVEPVDQ
jgi:hypothetical protein